MERSGIPSDKSLLQRKSTERSTTTWFSVALALVILLHVAKAALFIAAGQPPLFGDSAQYWDLTERIRQGDWALVNPTPEVRRTPGYSFFLLPFQALAGSHAMAALLIVQELMVVATALVGAWICRQATGSRLGALIAMALSLFCVSQNSVAQYLLSDTVLCLLITLCIAAVATWLDRPTAAQAVGVGLLLGAATLVKPAVLFVCVPVVAVMAMELWRTSRAGTSRGSPAGLPACRSTGGNVCPSRRRALRRWLAHVALVVIPMLLVLAPWMLRNQVYCGRPFLVKYLGANLWWSLFKGDLNQRFDPAIPFADTANTKTTLAKLDGVDLHNHYAVFRKLESLGYSHCEIDDLMTAVCWDAIRQHPYKYLASRCLRFAWFWADPNGTFRPHTGIYHSPWRASPVGPAEDEIWSKGSYRGQRTWHGDWYFEQGRLNWLWHPHPLAYSLAALAAAAGVAGLLVLPGYRTFGILLGSFLLYFSLVTVITACPEYRYRMVLEPLMVVGVTTGALAVFQRFRTCH